MSYTPSHLGHVNIFVRNAEKAQKWYTEVLGLHTYDIIPGRAAFMSANKDESHEIAVIEVGENAAGPQQGQVGLNHMAWRMGSLKDLEDFYHRLEEMNVPIGRVSNHGISLGIYLQDPDGNGIEVYYETPRSEWPSETNIFSERKFLGEFPGPWEKELAPDAIAQR